MEKIEIRIKEQFKLATRGKHKSIEYKKRGKDKISIKNPPTPGMVSIRDTIHKLLDKCKNGQIVSEDTK